MIVQIKRVFESYSFFVTKENKKSRQALHEIFFNPNTRVKWCLSLLQNQRPLFLLHPSLLKNISTPGSGSMKSLTNSGDYQPSPPGLTSRIHPLISTELSGLYFSPEYLSNFFSELYKYFQIYAVYVTRKCICESTLPGRGELLMPQVASFQKSVPQQKWGEGNYVTTKSSFSLGNSKST